MPLWALWSIGGAVVALAGEGIRRAGQGVEDAGQGLAVTIGAGVVAGIAAPIIVKALRK